MSNKDVSQTEPNSNDNLRGNDDVNGNDVPTSNDNFSHGDTNAASDGPKDRADGDAAPPQPAKSRRRAPRKTKPTTEAAAAGEQDAAPSTDAGQPEDSGQTDSSVQADILADLQSFAAEHASESEPEKPAKTPRRRSSTKKSASVDDKAESGAPTDGTESADAQTETPETPDAAPARSRQRRGGSDDTEPSARRARRAAIDPFAIPDEFASMHPSSGAPDNDNAGNDNAGSDNAGNDNSENDRVTDEEEPTPAPRLDTTNAPAGLLFQAPAVEFAQPQPRRRRDDSADDDVNDHDDSNDDSSADDGADEDSAGSDSGSDRRGSDDSQDDKRPRRRRGGRGRRGRSKDDESDDSESDDRDDVSESNDGGDSSKGGSPKGGSSKGGAGKKDSSKNGSNDDRDSDDHDSDDSDDDSEGGSRKRRRRRRRSGDSDEGSSSKGRDSRKSDEVSGVKGSTRLEAKRQRRREGREAGRRRPVITEAEFLARRESVDRHMVVRQSGDRTQIAVLEDKLVVEHYVSQHQQASLIGNVYLGKVQNVLPSMEAAFVDIGRGRNAVLYAGEVNWDAASMQGKARRIEQALKPGDPVLVQVTKDPIGHKGARLTSQISMPGRFLVYVPGNSMTGISRKLPDTERSRLKKILRSVLPNDAGVIVRTAAEGASEEELTRDVERLSARWEKIEKKSTANSTLAPELLYSEPDLTVRVIRDVFNEDFKKLSISGDEAWDTISEYVESVAPDLADRLERWDGDDDIFESYRVDEQISKALDRKVNLPSGGSLVIDRTEAMTVVDVNTGKFTGSGGNLEETVTKNNLEAAEEVIRQLRLRDIGGIIVIDFIDMVLESNRDLVLRRLIECLGRDRTKHQVAEVTSLGLVQMTRKRIGTGLVEAYSEPCEHCGGRGIILTGEASEKRPGSNASPLFGNNNNKSNRRRGRKEQQPDTSKQDDKVEPERDEEAEKAAAANREALAKVAAAAKKSHTDTGSEPVVEEAPAPSKRGKGSSRGSKKRSGNREQQGSGESGAGEQQGPDSKGTGSKGSSSKDSDSEPAQSPAEPAAKAEPEKAPVAKAEPAAKAEPEKSPAEPEVADPNAPMMLGVGAKPVVMTKAEPKRRPRRAPKSEPADEPVTSETAAPVIMLGMESTKKSD